jgi:hypothetical protein
MAERDKVIKSGQLTIPRLAFLAVVGLLLWAIVFLGGVYLSIGYWILTLGICGLLFLIAIDYGVHMDKVSLASEPAQAAATESGQVAASGLKASVAEPKAKKRTSRPAKRRR